MAIAGPKKKEKRAITVQPVARNRPHAKNKSYPTQIANTKALRRDGVIALGAVVFGTGVALAGAGLELPIMAAAGVATSAAGTILKLRDTIRERNRLSDKK